MRIEPVRLQEAFVLDYEYHVSTRVKLTGKLTLPPPDKDKKPVILDMSGSSAIEYDERMLESKDGTVGRTVRVYREMEFDRTVGDQAQKSTLRPEVRRLVLLRRQKFKGPFCPEGPLTPGEIDLIRTDVFTPALVGLLPTQAVKAGDRWTVTTAAVQELTDLDQIEGKVECRLDDVTTLNERRCARVFLSGTVKGVNEDGPERTEAGGAVLFRFGIEPPQLPLSEGHSHPARQGWQGGGPDRGAVRADAAGQHRGEGAESGGPPGADAGADGGKHASAVRQSRIGSAFRLSAALAAGRRYGPAGARWTGRTAAACRSRSTRRRKCRRGRSS